MGSEGKAEAERLSVIVDEFAAAFDCPREEAIERIESLAAVTRREHAVGPKALRTFQRVRMRRNALLGVDLFRDPAWDMLIELMIARREGQQVSVSALCAASGVPQTTALRHIERMAEFGLVTRTGDFADHRRVLVALVPAVVPRVEGMLQELRLAFGAALLLEAQAEPG